MRFGIASVFGVVLLTSSAMADGTDPSPGVQRQRTSSRYRIYSYPPTYIRDGHSYFYFPGENARRDQLAEPVIKRRIGRHHVGYYNYPPYRYD